MKSDNFQANVELNYPLLNWEVIWRKNFKHYIVFNIRDILYKYSHENITTNDRLHMLKILEEIKCKNCGDLENNMHIIYFCSFKMFVKSCRVQETCFIQILKLNFKSQSHKYRNTDMVLL